MNAKELMIGNWVKTKTNKYGTINELNTDCLLTTLHGVNGCWSYDSIEPIPLTVEILEKNGWSHDIYDNESYDNEDAEMLSLWVGEDGRNAWWWHAGFELVIPINYVHQLQNALALCGIEKEIVL